MRYGFLPEFIGRFPVLAKLHALTQSEMVHVMTKPRNALLKQYSALFAADGVELVITNGAVNAISRRAKQSNTGARGLRSIVEQASGTRRSCRRRLAHARAPCVAQVLMDSMYSLPKWKEQGVEQVLITEDTVELSAAAQLHPPPREAQPKVNSEGSTNLWLRLPHAASKLRGRSQEEAAKVDEDEAKAATG